MALYLERGRLFENFCALQSTSIYTAARMTENRVIKIRVILAGPEFYLSEDPCVHEKFDKSKWVLLFRSYCIPSYDITKTELFAAKLLQLIRPDIEKKKIEKKRRGENTLLCARRATSLKRLN